LFQRCCKDQSLRNGTEVPQGNTILSACTSGTEISDVPEEDEAIETYDDSDVTPECPKCPVEFSSIVRDANSVTWMNYGRAVWRYDFNIGRNVAVCLPEYKLKDVLDDWNDLSVECEA
jgi:hypothetical protein